MAEKLTEAHVGDKVIYRANVEMYTEETIEAENTTHVTVCGKKYRRTDGRAVGVRPGSTEWFYCYIRPFNQKLLDDNAAYLEHRRKVNAIYYTQWGKMFSKDVDEIYEFLKSKGVILEE